MSMNTLFLTFSYFMVFNMFKFNDFFARRRESGFTRTIWNLKRSFKENPTFPIYIQLLCLLQFRENSFPKHIAVSKYLQLQQHTMFTEIIIYRKYFFCILMTSSLILWYLGQKSNQFSNDSIVCLLLLRGPFISSKRNIDLSEC